VIIEGLEYELEYYTATFKKYAKFRCPLCNARVAWEFGVDRLLAMVNRDPDPRGIYTIAVFQRDNRAKRYRTVHVVDETKRNGKVVLFTLHTDTCPRASELKWGGAP